MLRDLKARHFRCFDSLAIELDPDLNLFVGNNAQGKTSLLEAACVLLRLQSPRTASLASAVQHGATAGFSLEGHFDRFHLQFRYLHPTKRLHLDSSPQPTARDYLAVGRAVYLSNRDIDIVRNPGETRRRFLDFACLQIEPTYRAHFRAYDAALRSRNRLLRDHPGARRQIVAFNPPLAAAGAAIAAARARIVSHLASPAAAAHLAISGAADRLDISYRPGTPSHPDHPDQLAAALDAALEQDLRRGLTTVGPHRDDLEVLINARDPSFASEGQQRSAALALKLAQYEAIATHASPAAPPPILLVDDVFGELDPRRRNALFSQLPTAAQKLVTTTHLDWLESFAESRRFAVAGGTVTPAPSRSARGA